MMHSKFEKIQSDKILSCYFELSKSDSSEKLGIKGFHTNIQEDTLKNNNYRKVLYTSKHLQLVVMSLLPGEDIGFEVHNNDQFFRFEEGEGKCIINSNEYIVKDGSAIIIPAGCKHNVINTGTTKLKMYTLYSPPHHKDGITRVTKEEAEREPEKFNNITTEGV